MSESVPPSETPASSDALGQERTSIDSKVSNSALGANQEFASGPNLSDAELNRVIKKFGGRHLIFRTQLESWNLIPKPYALISDFCGPVWFFYGMGQIWLTHKKARTYDGWTARVSRFGSENVIRLLDQLEDDITDFTHFCNEHGIEGTILLDPGIIEFHWTFGYELKQEKQKPERSNPLEARFKALTEKFLEAKQELRI